MSGKLPECNVDTLLERKECLTGLKEGIKYDLEKFPFFFDRLKGTILHVEKENSYMEKQKGELEGKQDIDSSLELAMIEGKYETNIKLLENYNAIINNGVFEVIKTQYEDNVMSNSLISSIVTTIKSGEVEFKVSTNILKKVM